MTGHLSDRVSVLGEIEINPMYGSNGVSFDIERLLLQYKQNDYFGFSVGRYHTGLGYYNPTFHRGAWFQTTVDRPFMYAFDGEGGGFPVQMIGVSIGGGIPSGKLGLQYLAEFGNGRSHLLGAEPAENHFADSNGKAVNFGLSAHPSSISGLDVGFSIYHQNLIMSNNISHDEIISIAYVVYTNSNYEFLNEAEVTRHTVAADGSPGVFHTPAFYTQVSRRFGKFRPYIRFQYINAGLVDPIFADPVDIPVIGRRDGPSAGVRFDFNDHAAFKLQYDHLTRRGSDAISDGTVTNANQLQTQFSFAF
jgi:hypothetical protein